MAKSPTSREFQDAHEVIAFVQKYYPGKIRESLELLTDESVKKVAIYIAMKMNIYYKK